MSENMTSMSSEQVDVLVNNTDNIWVVDETSIEDTSQNDNIKNNDQGSLSIKPFSNIEHNRDNIKNNDQETDSTQPSSNTENNRDNIKSNNQETVSRQPSSNTEHNRDNIKSNDQETVSTQPSSNTEHKRDNIKRNDQETVSTQPSSNTEHNRDNIKSNDQETVSTQPSSNTEHNRDDRKRHDQEIVSTQPSSNTEQNGEELLVASGSDGCLKVMSREDNDQQLNADNDCRMFDIQKCSSLNAEPITETCEEKVLLNLGPDFTEMYEQTVLLQPCQYHVDIMDGPNCQDASETGNSSNADSAFLLPDFTRLYDDDDNDETGSVLGCEPISCDSDNVTPSSSSQIPYFEKCSAPDGDLIPFDCVPEAVTSSTLEEKSLIELMKEIREDLTDVGERNDPETDLRLEHLNEDNNTNCNSLPTKTKSAKKRKKQQLKLKKFSAPNIPSPRRQKFAQTFDELKRSYVDFGDYNLDSSITCPVCLDLYHLPSICQPCGHMFCDLCLRRLTGLGTEGIPCPLCRAVISSCELNREFDENLLLNYPDIYTARAMSERHSKYRHQLLPYTPPVPLRKRLMCKLIASRNQQSDMRWMSHDSFKFLLGCTVGLFIASLVMLYSRVTSVNEARDVNIVFLSVLLGATVTYLVFKYVKI